MKAINRRLTDKTAVDITSIIDRLTNETARTLLGIFNAKRARHVRFLAVALNRHVSLFVEFRVRAAKVLAVRIGVGTALETAYSFGTCTFQNNEVLITASSESRLSSELEISNVSITTIQVNFSIPGDINRGVQIAHPIQTVAANEQT